MTRISKVERSNNMTTTLDSHDKSGKLFALAMILMGILGVGAVLVFAANREIVAQAAESVEIDGDDLTLLDTTVADPEVGTTFPTVKTVGFDGESLSIEPDGRPKVIYFLAHWCGFCQEEVPVLQSLIDEGNVPEGLDILSVVSLTHNPDAENPAGAGNAGNYPPSSWLDKEDWTPPALLDTFESEIFQAAGGTGTPFVVALDGDNTVLSRISGNMTPTDTVNLWNATAASIATGTPAETDEPTTETEVDTEDSETQDSAESTESTTETEETATE